MSLQGIFYNSFSIGDDNIVYKWNITTNQTTKFMELDAFSTDHDWVPHTKGSS
jgi:hypothetical protein